MTHEPHAYCQAQTRRFDARIFLPVLVGCMLVLNSTLFYLNRKGLPHRGFRNFYVGAVILDSHCGAEVYALGLHRHFQGSSANLVQADVFLARGGGTERVVFIASKAKCRGLGRTDCEWLLV